MLFSESYRKLYSMDRIQKFTKILIAFVSSGAVTVLVGWLLNIEFFTNISPNFASMKFNTALCFLLASIAIAFINRPQIRQRLGTIIILIAGLTVIQYGFQLNIGIDELFVRDMRSIEYPGRMSIATAINFFLLGLAIVLGFQSPNVTKVLILVTITISLIALGGYIYNANVLYRVTMFSTMALHTVLSFLALALTLLLSNSDEPFVKLLSSDTSGSDIIRALIPITLITMIVIPWVIRIGQVNGLYPLEAALVLDIMITLLVLMFAFFSIAQHLYNIEQQQLATQQKLNQVNDTLEEQIEERTDRLRTINTTLTISIQRYHQAESIGKFGHWKYLVDKQTFEWSKGMYRLFGLEDSQPASLQELLKYLHKDDRKNVLSSFQNSIETGDPTEIEYRIIGLDGDIHYHYTLAQTEKDSDGKIINLIGISIDVTELHQIKQETHIYKLTLEESTDLIAVVDRDYRYIIANKTYLDYYQFEAEEVIGKHLSDVLGEANFDQNIQRHLNRCLEGEEQNSEIVWEFPELGQRNMQVTYKPIIGSDDIFYIAIIIHDITDLKSVNSYLQQSLDEITEISKQLEINRALFSSVLGSAPDAIIVADEEHNIIIFNNSATELFGYSSNEVIGKPLNTLVPIDKRSLHTNHMKHFAESNIPYRQLNRLLTDFTGLRKDGSLVPIDISIAHVQTRDRTIFTSIIRDITVQKKVEQTLLTAKENAESANVAKSIFLSTMSHELRTPLNAIIGFTQLLEQQYRTNSKEGERLHIIEKSAHHLLDLINDILEVSRIESGHVTINEHSFDLHALLDDLADTFLQRAIDKDLQLIIDYDPQLHQYISTDMRKLRQILMTLIDNALKFTRKGSVSLRVKQQGQSLVFEVEDSGIGIAEEELEKLFKPFSQTLAGQKAKKGSGLGLAICRHYINLLGGEIEVDSKIGRGTLMRFYIQAMFVKESDLDQSPSTQNVIGLKATNQQWRILVVDDRDESRLLLRDLLIPIGFKVEEAINGRDAVEKCQSWHPHLILIDMHVSEIDAFEFVELIKVEPGLSPIIIAMTDNTFEDKKQAVFPAGCDDIIAKPFQFYSVLTTIAYHLNLDYVYAEDDPVSEVPTLNLLNMKQRLANITPELQAELLNATKLLNTEMVETIIETIQKNDDVLAATLLQLLDNYRFDVIRSALNEINSA